MRYGKGGMMGRGGGLKSTRFIASQPIVPIKLSYTGSFQSPQLGISPDCYLFNHINLPSRLHFLEQPILMPTPPYTYRFGLLGTHKGARHHTHPLILCMLTKQNSPKWFNSPSVKKYICFAVNGWLCYQIIKIWRVRGSNNDSKCKPNSTYFTFEMTNFSNDRTKSF